MSYHSPSRAYEFQGRTVAWDAIGSGPPLIVVHGTPWSSYNLRHLISALARSHRVYYYDLLGYGRSDKSPGDVSLGIQNQILDALLDHWGIAEPIAVGHDFGGAVLLRTRLLNERRYSRLVLIDAVAVRPWGSSFFRQVREHEAAFAGVPAYMHEAMVRAYIKTAAHAEIDPAVLEETIRPWTGADGQSAFYRQIAQATQAHTDEVQDRYGEISEPTLVLWGEEDEWIPRARGEELAGLLPNAAFHPIPRTGHLVIEERPDELVAHIERFLADA